MKSLIALTFVLISLRVFALEQQPNTDSLVYQQQRQKINTLLTQRSVKFGQYDISLTKHTGIFGLQTKKDIRRSNDILIDVIKTDNTILEQTKVLLSLKDNQLNYRTYQQQNVESRVKESQDVSVGFMTTINKLRAQNEKLSTQLVQADEKRKNNALLVIFVCVLMVSSILILYNRRRKIKV